MSASGKMSGEGAGRWWGSDRVMVGNLRERERCGGCADREMRVVVVWYSATALGELFLR
jgi:hypothetical protein